MGVGSGPGFLKSLKWTLGFTLACGAFNVFGAVHSYFNHNDANSYTDPYRKIFRPGDNLEEILIGAIQNATQTIDIAVHEFRLPLVAKALAEKAAQNVRVRVVLENSYNFALKDLDWGNIRDDYNRRRYADYFLLVDVDRNERLDPWEFDDRDALYILRKANIPVIDDTEDGSKGSDLMHHKFMVIDGRHVLTGSTNYTLSDVHGDMGSLETRGNANNLVVFSDEPEVVKLFRDEFTFLWGDGPGGRKDSFFGQKKPYRPARRIALSNGDFANIQFSPTSKNFGYEGSSGGLISRTLAMMNKTLDAALFVFSDQKLSTELAGKYLFGQQSIRALVENRFAFQWYSELLDMLGVEMLSDKCETQRGNQPWARPIQDGGTPGLANGDMLHHKFGVVDNYYTIFGSHNWTDAANYGNDEALVVLESFETGNAFSNEFARLYKNSELGVPDWVTKKIEKQQHDCASKKFFGGFDTLFDI
jgi:phosphatidylserine/phosphatidylglycerophosphate/cardiolipin synthase-like enzyme